MKIRKLNRSWLERKRVLFFEIGLILSLALVLVAFEWKTPYHEIDYFSGIEEPLPDPTPTPKPTPPEEHKETKKKKVATILNIVDKVIDPDEEDIDIFAGWDDDIDNTESVFAVTLKEEKEAVDPIIEVPSKMPEFEGGMAGLQKYLSTTIDYPLAARQIGIEGTVFVEFVVEKDGTVSNLRILRSPDETLEKEAIRVMRSMPSWTPGYQGIHKVRVRMVMPIQFKLK